MSDFNTTDKLNSNSLKAESIISSQEKLSQEIILAQNTTVDFKDNNKNSKSSILTDTLNTAKQGLYALAIDPMLGLLQIADHTLGSKITKSAQNSLEDSIFSRPEKANFDKNSWAQSGSWYAEQIASAAGMAVPFLLIHKGIKSIGNSGILGESGLTKSLATIDKSGGIHTHALQEGAISGLTGFTYGSLLKPSENNDNFWSQRLGSGLVDAATFSVLGSSSQYLSYGLRKGLGDISNIANNPIIPGALAAIPAGWVAAHGNSLLHEGRLANEAEIYESRYSLAFAGAALGGGHWLKSEYNNSGKTNARHYLDKWTNSADSQSRDTRTFRSLNKEKDRILEFKDTVQNNPERAADITLLAQAKLETALGKLFGNKTFGIFGDAKYLSLRHNSNNSPDSVKQGQTRDINTYSPYIPDLIATCTTLTGKDLKLDLFPNRTNKNMDVWLDLGNFDRQSRFSQNFDLKSQISPPESASENLVKLGPKTEAAMPFQTVAEVVEAAKSGKLKSTSDLTVLHAGNMELGKTLIQVDATNITELSKALIPFSESMQQHLGRTNIEIGDWIAAPLSKIIESRESTRGQDLKDDLINGRYTAGTVAFFLKHKFNDTLISVPGNPEILVHHYPLTAIELGEHSLHLFQGNRIATKEYKPGMIITIRNSSLRDPSYIESQSPLGFLGRLQSYNDTSLNLADPYQAMAYAYKLGFRDVKQEQEFTQKLVDTAKNEAKHIDDNSGIPSQTLLNQWRSVGQNEIYQNLNFEQIGINKFLAQRNSDYQVTLAQMPPETKGFGPKGQDRVIVMVKDNTGKIVYLNILEQELTQFALSGQANMYAKPIAEGNYKLLQEPRSLEYYEALQKALKRQKVDMKLGEVELKQQPERGELQLVRKIYLKDAKGKEHIIEVEINSYL